MERVGAPLEGTRAIGRLGADGPWIGFGYRAGVPHLVVGRADGTHDAPALIRRGVRVFRALGVESQDVVLTRGRSRLKGGCPSRLPCGLSLL